MLLIAPPNSYRIHAYLDAARRLDLELQVASQGQHSLVEPVARGLQVDLSDPAAAAERILAQVAEVPPHGIVGTDDATVEIAARVAAGLGRDHNSPEAALLARRKDLARARLARCGVAAPAHTVMDLSAPSADVSLSYPCVVKPVSLSGSRGVIRADTPEQLVRACDRIRDLLEREEGLPRQERSRVLVEQFVAGPEIALEGLLRDGKLEVLALFDKPDPLEGPYFEETYYVSPSRLPGAVQTQVRDTVQQACDAYGLRQGPVHAELRLAHGRAWVIEVAARTIGGQCARLLQLGTGYGLEELVLAQAVGTPLSTTPAEGGAGVLMLPIEKGGILRRVEGIMDARRIPFVEELEISVREGYELVPPPEGASYLGFVFARAPTPRQAERALRQAYGCLKVVTAPVLAAGRLGGM